MTLFIHATNIVGNIPIIFHMNFSFNNVDEYSIELLACLTNISLRQASSGKLDIKIKSLPEHDQSFTISMIAFEFGVAEKDIKY